MYRNSLKTSILYMAIALGLGAGGSMAAAEEVGKAVKIVNDVRSLKNSQVRKLAVSEPVFASEIISATSSSHGEILLSDRTKIIVGPGAKLALDDFVVADTNLQSGTLKIAKGALRFISPRAKKAKFKIKTPVATIGIRGTSFDVYVKPDGTTDVVLFSGKVNVCNGSNTCHLVEKSCEIVRVNRDSSIQSREFLREKHREIEDDAYDLTNNQARFPFAWRAPTLGCSVRAVLKRTYKGRMKQPFSNDTNSSCDGIPSVTVSTPTPSPSPNFDHTC